MADVGVRCTMFFHLDRAGWSESHINTAATINAAVRNDFVELFKARMQLSTAPVVAFRGRMSLLNSPRSSVLLDNVSMNQIQQSLGSPVAANDKADQPKAAALCRFYATDVSKKNLYISGIPDAIITEDPEGLPAHVNPLWQARFDAYKAQLINGRWGYRGRVPPTVAPAVPVAALSTLQRESDGAFGVTVAHNALAVAEGDKLQLRNFKMNLAGQLSPNGVWEVLAFNASSPTADKDSIYFRRSTMIDAEEVRLLGTVGKVVYDVFPYTSGIIVSQTTHLRGNSFLFGRGRRASRAVVPH